VTSPAERRLRIAHVVPVYPPRRGGMGVVAHEYAVRLRQRGHFVRVFTPRCQAIPDDQDDATRLRSFVSAGNAAFVPSLAWRLGDVDLVHLHYPFFGGAEPVLLGKLLHRRQPLIVTYHMDAIAEGLKGMVFGLYRRLVLPRVIAHADLVLVSSMDYARSSELARMAGGLPRLEQHSLGVDVDRFQPGSEPALRSQLGIAADLPVLLFVGALDRAHHFKGVPQLVEALARVRDCRWHLVVVGDGSARDRFENLAGTQGLGERVHFAGDVGDADLPRYYRLADLHLFPSTGGAESFGLVCLEAAASGIPTIASSLSGVRTVVLDGETGLHVSPGSATQLADAIRMALERPELRRALGESARRRAAAEFNWDARVDQLERTYQRTIARTKAIS
jgi:glycosyltransferase involved in cell wall biosynthesis